MNRCVNTGATHIPAVRFPTYRDRLGCALQVAAPTDAVATYALKTWVAWCLLAVDAPEERLKSSVQPSQYILRHLGVDVTVFRPEPFTVRQMGALHRLG